MSVPRIASKTFRRFYVLSGNRLSRLFQHPASNTVLQTQRTAEGATGKLAEEGTGEAEAEGSDGMGIMPLGPDAASRGVGSWPEA